MRNWNYCIEVNLQTYCSHTVNPHRYSLTFCNFLPVLIRAYFLLFRLYMKTSILTISFNLDHRILVIMRNYTAPNLVLTSTYILLFEIIQIRIALAFCPSLFQTYVILIYFIFSMECGFFTKCQIRF